MKGIKQQIEENDIKQGYLTTQGDFKELVEKMSRRVEVTNSCGIKLQHLINGKWETVVINTDKELEEFIEKK